MGYQARAAMLRNGTVVSLDIRLSHADGIIKEGIQDEVEKTGFIFGGRWIEKGIPQRRIFVIPAAEIDSANATLEALGYGPKFFSVPVRDRSIDFTRAPEFYLADGLLQPGMVVEIAALLSSLGLQIFDEGTLDERERNKTGVANVLKTLQADIRVIQ